MTNPFSHAAWSNGRILGLRNSDEGLFMMYTETVNIPKRGLDAKMHLLVDFQPIVTAIIEGC